MSRPADGLGLVETRHAHVCEAGLELACGRRLDGVTVAYECYGRLNPARDNAILVCHALSGGAHAAGRHEGAAKPGWWDVLIGPGKAFDTDRYFVVSSNVLGSCYGTTGPASIDPASGRPYGSRFPVVTIGDMVKVQRALVDQPRHQPPARRRGRIDGRHAGAAVGGPVPRCRPIGCRPRHVLAPLAAADRVQRDRAAGRDERPELAGRGLLRGRTPAVGARPRAHARPRHVPVGPGDAPEVRTPPPDRRRAVRLRARVRGRELPGTPEPGLRGSFRRELAALSHPRDRLLRSGSGRGHARRRLQRQRRGVPVPHVLVRLAVSAVPPRRGGGRGTGRGPARQLPGDSQRLRPRRLPARARGAGTRHSRVSCRGRSV